MSTQASDLVRLEHANFACSDLAKTQEFFKNVFPDWSLRAEGLNQEGHKWVHFGSNQYYVALTQNPKLFQEAKGNKNTGINHIGFVIRDGAAMVERLKKHNIPYGIVPTAETKFRIYAYDPDGRELIELIEYNAEYPMK